MEDVEYVTQADETCKRWGGVVARPTSEEEKDQLYDEISKQ